MRVKNFCCALLLALLTPLGLMAQGTTGTVTGVITSDTRQPLAGVQVSIQGTRLGGLTGEDGRYTIQQVPAGQHVILTTYIGYADQQQTITVQSGEPTVVNFQLVSRAIALKEMVVVGYGTQKRETVTGSVATVTSEEFVKGPARDIASMVAGRMPGLAVSQPSGNPNQEAQIMLRGVTTVSGNRDPLVLIDGVPGGLQTVPAEDIETISVLKDGSAAAIYGSRASNGVILITTKRHTGGRATFRYDGYIGQSRIYKQPDFLTASDYRQLIAEGYQSPAGATFEDLGFETDWFDQVLRNPMSYRHNFSVAGGALNTNYTASLNLENEEGIFNRSDNNEMTVRANIRHQMFDGKIEAEGNLLSRTRKGISGPNFNYAWRQAMIRNPTDRVVDETGAWQNRGGYFYTNPVALINEVNGQSETRSTRLHGTLSYRPFSALRLSAMGGVTRDNFLSGNATTFNHPDYTPAGGGSASRSTSSGYDRILELTGTLQEAFGQHNVTLLGGYSYQDFLDESFNASNSRFPTDQFGWDQLGLGSGLTDGVAGMNSGKSSNKLIGFFGRVNYDWKNKYMLMASVRHEGNSRFGADHKWGLFPAASVGWRVSEESFMDGLSFINDLRLRAGYGVTGIAPNQNYLSLASYAFGSRVFYNGQWVRTLVPARNPNPDLRWEEKHEINVGANLTAFDSRLNATLDVYQRETRDMLYNYSVPVPPYLFGSILANVGTMKNNGIEVELAYDVVRRNGFNWTSSFNWSTNSNKLVSLSNEQFEAAECRTDGHTGEPIQQSTHRNCIGDPIGNFYGYKSVDVDENGVWIVLDSAGAEIPITAATAKDRHVLGNGLPKHFFGWNNTARIGSFDVNVGLRGAAGFQVLNFMRMYYENPRITQYNMLKSAFDPVYGKKKADGSPLLVNHDLSYVSYYIEDGDYLKVDNVTLGYTIPQSMLGRLAGSVSNARVYVSGRNLYTFTGYKGLDPEVRMDGLAPGNDSRDTYPTIRQFTFGLTFGF